jgi:hypothetical protein
MKPKTKTIMERHGFRDPDRMKPTHDEIQLWAYKNFCFIVKRILPQYNECDITSHDLKLEFAVTDRQFVVGFIDIYCNILKIAIEVKTEIPSVGELLRQIHFYKEYMKWNIWIVVSPDERAASIMMEQGINFFRYEPTEGLGQTNLKF